MTTPHSLFPLIQVMFTISLANFLKELGGKLVATKLKLLLLLLWHKWNKFHCEGKKTKVHNP